MKYQQLTQDERYMISQLRQQGCEASEIARFMARDRSTIWRELKRNMIEMPKGLTGSQEFLSGVFGLTAPGLAATATQALTSLQRR